MDNATPSDLIARRVREIREERRWTVADLAKRCADAGMPKLTAQALYKLEGQRQSEDRPPRRITVDELLVLAYVLDVAPTFLVTGWDEPNRPFPATPALTVSAHEAQMWFRGYQELPGNDPREFAAKMPLAEQGAYAPDLETAIAVAKELVSNLESRRGIPERLAEIRAEALRGLDRRAAQDDHEQQGEES